MRAFLISALVSALVSGGCSHCRTQVSAGYHRDGIDVSVTMIDVELSGR